MPRFHAQLSLAALLLPVLAVLVGLAIFSMPSRLGDALLIAALLCLSTISLVGIARGTHSGIQRPTFQFSLKGAFLAMTVAGALTAAWVHLPHFVLLLWAIAAIGVLAILVESRP